MKTFEDSQKLIRLLLLDGAQFNVLISPKIVKEIEGWLNDGEGIDLIQDARHNAYPYATFKSGGFNFYEEPNIDNIVFFAKESPLSMKDVSFEDIVEYHEVINKILSGKKFVTNIHGRNDFHAASFDGDVITYLPITHHNLHWEPSNTFPPKFIME